MSDYRAIGRIPAGEVQSGHIVDAREIFSEWPGDADILSPLEAVDSLDELRHVTVTRTWTDGPTVSVFEFHDGNFGVMANQPVTIHEET